MKYAMILKGRVIDVIINEVPPKFPPDIEGNTITAVKCDDSVVCGMTYTKETNEFRHHIYPVAKPSGLARIQTAVQASEDLQAFYDDIVKEVGL